MRTTVAYPPGGTSYVRDGKTYYPASALMLAEAYVPDAPMKLSAKLLAQLPADALGNPPPQPPVGWWASEKMDGLRCLFNGETLVTRSSPGKDPKAFGFVPAWFLEPLRALPRGLALDGELWMGRGRFHDVAGISTVLPPTDPAAAGELDRRWRAARFSVFDAPSAPGGFEERLAAAAAALAAAALAAAASLPKKPKQPSAAFVEMLPQTRVRDAGHLAAMMRDVVGRGGEGLVLRAPGSPYVPRRSKFMLKMKVTRDTEVRVTGYELGDAGGKYAGYLGALVGVELSTGSAEVRVGTGFSDAERRDFRRLFPIDTIASVSYMERTPAGALRMPVFRGVREDLGAAVYP